VTRTVNHKKKKVAPKAPEHRRQSVYLPQPLLIQLRAEAQRLDRSMSWLIQRAWKVALGQIRRMPAP
jgi:uncharacterized small protein (TIGR04563 family)